MAAEETQGTGTTAKQELDEELQKIGATVAKVGNGALTFIENLGEDVAVKLAPVLEGVLEKLATGLIGKALAKYGITV